MFAWMVCLKHDLIIILAMGKNVCWRIFFEVENLKAFNFGKFGLLKQAL